jgi:MipA family protein
MLIVSQRLLILGFIVTSGVAGAQEKKTEGVTTTTSKPLWELGVGVGGLRAPAYIGAEQSTQRALPLPYFVYRGDVFRIDEDGVEARILKGENYEFDLSLGASLGGGNQKIKLRDGMPKLGPSFEIGPRFSLTIARPSKDSKISLGVPVRAVLEFNGGVKARGFIVEPNVNFTKQDIGWGISLVAQAGVIWGDQRVQQHYYSVLPQYATSARPTYTAKAGLLTTRLSVGAFKDLTPNMGVGLFVRSDLASNAANQKSPLHVRNNGYTVGIGFNYTFAKSSVMVDR